MHMELSLPALVSLIGLFTFIGFLTLSYAVAGRLGTLQERFRQIRAEDQGAARRWRDHLDRSLRVLRRVGELIPRSPGEMSRQQKRLVQAGFRSKDAPLLFLGAQAGLVILLLFASGLSGRVSGSNVLVYGALSLLLGAALPDLWLSDRIRRRKERIQLALPDALDLQVVCVEAGLGLDQSLRRIGQEFRGTHPDLSDELQLLGLELNAGMARAEALRNLAKRTDVEDLRSLVAVLIQTDRFGTGIADSLRVFSDSLRTKRRQRAEEFAAKMGVKMIPPLFVFILPATFVVVVGPAIVGIATGLLTALRAPVQ
jgi:tight adherence protein C